MKLPTLVPAALLFTKQFMIHPAGPSLHPYGRSEASAKPAPCFPTAQILARLGHSRTLYTSNALDQSNFII